ncbi:SemiSWEET family sugar transporter [Methanoregula sp.]|uniref:SemiSWEET family sugar transporter n=1 Tax=Methanoregula sp. TaxID=2052170 RepID=UPI003567C0E2
MDSITVIGFIAGAFTTLAFVPQVVRSLKLKETKDLSLAMLAIFFTGFVLWIVYGFWTESLPVIVANVASLFLLIVLIGIKLRYR